MEAKGILIEKDKVTPVFTWKRLSASAYGHERDVPCIELRTEGKTYELYDRAYARFLGLLKTGRRAMDRQLYKYDGKKKIYLGTGAYQQDLTNLYRLSSLKYLQLLTDGNKVIRITTQQFIGVDTDMVESICEKRLEAEGIKFEKFVRYNGNYVTYKFTNASYNHPKGIDSTMGFYNHNSGENAMQFFGGGMVQVCSNGMMAPKRNVRLVHKIDHKELRVRVERILTDILDEIKILPRYYESLRNKRLTIDEARKVVYGLQYPKYLKDAVWARLFQDSTSTANGYMDWDGTMWGIYMAATYIASHKSSIAKSTNLEREVDMGLVSKLSNIHTFTKLCEITIK